MAALFLTVLKQVMSLFAMMSVGWVFGRLGKVDRTGTKQMTTILLYVVTPCVVLNSMLVERTTEILMALAVAGILSAVMYGIQVAGSLCLFWKHPPGRRAVRRLGCTYGNVGFMGLPLIQMVLGEQAVIYLPANMAIQNLFIWTHGVTMMSGKPSMKRAIVNPAMPSFLVGLGLLLTGIRPPDLVSTVMDFFAGLNTPLAMIVLGVQMANADVISAFRRLDLYWVAFLKLLVFPALFIILLYPLRLPFLVYCTLVIAMATPAAAYVSIFAQMFDGEEEDAVQIVVLTTLLSIVTLPVVATVVQYIAG